MFISLLIIGLWVLTAAGPAAASRLNLETWYFVKRQTIFVAGAFFVMLGCSFLDVSMIRRLSIMIMLPACLLLMLATVIFAPEVNGARRWLVFNGLSFQTSEILKPVLAVVFAQLLSSPHNVWRHINLGIVVSLLALVVLVLVSQPDIGQAIIICGIWIAEMFVFGLTLPVIAMIAFIGLIFLGIGALMLDHVKRRIETFLEIGAEHYQYQNEKSLEAIKSGGLFGKGFGSGEIKYSIPDVHTDFILAAMGEDLGVFLCLALLMIFAAIVFRLGVRAYASQSNFIQIATTGLVTYLISQVFINVGSTLRLIPTKGTTLPFISYGGSSMLAVAFGAGFLLALSRKRVIKL